MRAAIVKNAGGTPILGNFKEPVVNDDEIAVTVTAAALSNFSKSRSMGKHYSSQGPFPLVAGADGVGITKTGQHIYFALPRSPFGTLAEKSLANRRGLVVEVPDGLTDIQAAALANPGMSSWAALFDRARIQKGESVLINGATGTAGKLAVKIAKHLGAGRVIATGRNKVVLDELRANGADETISFDLNAENGDKLYENALIKEMTVGVDIILDYLWGESAFAIISAIAKTSSSHSVRFVNIGSISGQTAVSLPSAALRSSSIQLMGSGLKSVSLAQFLAAIKGVFDLAVTSGLATDAVSYPLADIEKIWQAPTNPRIVVAIND